MVKSKGPYIVLDYKICVSNTQTNNCNGWKDINVTFKNQVAETIISSENGGKNERNWFILQTIGFSKVWWTTGHIRCHLG